MSEVRYAYWWDRAAKKGKGEWRGPFEVWSFNGIYREVILLMGELPTLVPFEQVKYDKPFRFNYFRKGGYL